MTGLNNDNGIYSLQLSANDQLAFQWKVTLVDFDESRYLNAHIDYPVRQQYGAWFHRCFILPGDYLGNYTRTESLGAIALSKEQPVKITLQAADPAGKHDDRYLLGAARRSHSAAWSAPLISLNSLLTRKISWRWPASR